MTNAATRTWWAEPVFNGRGARTAHLLGTRTDGKPACGQHLGYGTLAHLDAKPAFGFCKRCEKAAAA